MATNYNYSPGCGACLGVFHVLFGLGSCGCGIASILFYSYAYAFGVGIWAGIAFYGTTGVLAFVSKGRNNCAITAYYTMSLLSVFVAIGQMGLYVWAVMNEIGICLNSSYYDVYSRCSQNQLRDVVLHGGLLTLAFLEWIIAMVSCCTACSCCCNSTVAPQTVVIHTTQPMPLQQQTYGGPAVMMPAPQAQYSGQIHTITQSMPLQQQAYGGPPVQMVPTPRSEIGGYPTGSNYVPMNSKPATDYSGRPPLISDGVPDDPQAYHNPTYDATIPTTLPQTAEY